MREYGVSCRLASAAKALLAATLAVSAIAAPASAAGPIDMRVADHLPVNYPFSIYSTHYWMDQVNAKLPNAVKFAYFPAEQAGKAKDMLSLVQSGVVDVGMVVPALVSDKLPLAEVVELPGAFKTTCGGVAAYWKLLKPGGILAKTELDPLGVRALYAVINPAYQAYTREKPLTNLDSFKGLKLRATPGGQGILVKMLGAIPITIAAPDTFEALSHGTIDGIVWNAPGIFGWDMTGYVKYMTPEVNFGTVATIMVISKQRFNALPADLQKVMDEEGDIATSNACAKLDVDSNQDIDTLKSKGVKTDSFSAEDYQKLRGMDDTVEASWASDMNKRGLQGDAVLKQFRDALADIPAEK